MKTTWKPKELHLMLFVGPGYYGSVLLCHPRAGPKKREAEVIQGWGLVWFVNEQERMPRAAPASVSRESLI